MSSAGQDNVAVIGGGVAGLSAACALADAGLKVTLFERRPYVGGRASSYLHPGTEEVIDNSQHVLFGCCTNLIRFYEKLGVASKIRWFRAFNFIQPGGRLTTFRPSAFLPAPLHSVPAFIRSPLFTPREKVAIGRAMSAMTKPLRNGADEDCLTWLRRHGQTEQAVRRFWEPVLFSALNEDLDKASIRYAIKVFRELFLNTATGGNMGVPNLPLSELYGHAIEYIRARGGEVRLRQSVNQIGSTESAVNVTSESGQQKFDYAVIAAPYHTLASLLPSDAAGNELRRRLEHFHSSPITAIHLWFDREVTPLPHAALLDRTIQWMYQKSKLQDREKNSGSYVELVVSASKQLLDKSREEIIEMATREFAEFFPVANQAKLLKATVTKEVHATFSVIPGLDEHRPGPQTGWPRVFLAGDWTATEWPATMEGAARSGYRAAEALTAALGKPREFLVPDLPARGLMKGK
ncbi:MAG TPA: hydroxysqualene dehydroxylase HpnE [Candidatus Limnocylindrales bacterium]|nr:hydroxysqualene dehydroxylase HpnE [Candidatus Limnocylindrales bacterium]